MADTRVKAEALKRFTQDVFVAAGLAPEAAEIEAEVLVWANLRGVDSHGVLRIPQYLASVESGGHNVNPDIRIEKETPATMLIEADHAFGPVVTVFAMKHVIEKARQVGIGWAAIRNTTHQGAMGYYALMAAQEDMAGIAIVCSPPNMAPYGAKAAGLHNSPIAIAVPGHERQALCLDMATSVAAGGKVQLAVDKGSPIPLGWALDKSGVPTTDPNLASILLPAGGHKGSSMALMFETLSSLMVGNPLLKPVLLQTGARARGQNSVVAAVNIAAFTDVEQYKRDVDGTIEGLKRLPTAEGFDQILMPGEPENRVYVERAANGIPLPEGTVRNLRAVAAKLGVALPEGL
jgi:LDH2 family malate/lactate/ureidoglycolate dehydrogenase